jgi:hypothetical protein
MQQQVELSAIMSKPADLKELWNNAVLQFGYIGFFSLTFPAAPFWGLLISFFHINFTFYSLSSQTQRPICLERDSIGIWKEIFFIYSLIALAVNAGILLFTSMGTFKLINYHRDSDNDWYRVTVIVAIAENVVFILKYVISMIIPDTPNWISSELGARKVRKTVDEEKAKIAHFKMKRAYKETRNGSEIASAKSILSGAKDFMGKEINAFKSNLNYGELAQENSESEIHAPDDSHMTVNPNPLQHHNVHDNKTSDLLHKK